MSIIAVDADGTCFTHDFPRIGKDIGAQRVLRRLVRKGHKLLLLTSRTDYENGTLPGFPALPPGRYLSEAVEWFQHNNIKLYGIQRHPGQSEHLVNKPYFDLLIDDKALGCPMREDIDISPWPFVDWDVVETYLIGMRYL